jgi:hypothetical protein
MEDTSDEEDSDDDRVSRVIAQKRKEEEEKRGNKKGRKNSKKKKDKEVFRQGGIQAQRQDASDTEEKDEETYSRSNMLKAIMKHQEERYPLVWGVWKANLNNNLKGTLFYSMKGSELWNHLDTTKCKEDSTKSRKDRCFRKSAFRCFDKRSKEDAPKAHSLVITDAYADMSVIYGNDWRKESPNPPFLRTILDTLVQNS